MIQGRAGHTTADGTVVGTANASSSFLDLVLNETRQVGSKEPMSSDNGIETPSVSFLDQLISANPEEALRLWCLRNGIDRVPSDPRSILREINRDIARLDDLISDQLHAILKHPRFQRLEAAWRGLRYLTDEADNNPAIRIRFLDVSWRTLVKDLDRSIDFDQSQLFKKVYTAEFGSPGGQPFSVLLGNYEMHPGISDRNPIGDLDALEQISQVAAASFAPFITAADPTLLGVESFGDLQRPMDLNRIFQQPEFARWRRLREQEESRFLGLVLPRIMLRRPYRDDPTRVDGFRYREAASEPGAGPLWGNAAFAFGGILIRAFDSTGWLADIRGVRRDENGGGLVTGLTPDEFGTDRPGEARRPLLNVCLSDIQEKDLAELGFMPFCPTHDGLNPALYSSTSVQKPQVYDRPDANRNARLSVMLQYLLCVSRLAHYLKVLGRDKVGSFMEAGDCENFLAEWLRDYVSQDDNATEEVKARYPLRDAEVQVREIPGRPGVYGCVIHLQPQYQLDVLSSGLTLTTELAPPGS